MQQQIFELLNDTERKKSDLGSSFKNVDITVKRKKC